MYLELPIKHRYVENFNQLLIQQLARAQEDTARFCICRVDDFASEDGMKFCTCQEMRKFSSRCCINANPRTGKGDTFELSLSKWGAGATKVYWGVARSV